MKPTKVTRRMVLDSVCRQVGEESDDYTVTLADPLKARSMALMASDIPFSAWTISPGCDTLDYWTSGTWHALQLAHGNVDDDTDLAQTVANALQTVDSNAAAAVLGEPDGRIQLTSQTPFRLSAGVCAARLVGAKSRPVAERGVGQHTFLSSVERSDGTHELTLPYRPNLDPDRYLVLKLDVAGAVESPNQAVDGAMSVLRPGCTDIAHPVYFETSIREIHRVRISITRVDGSRYDFRGHDHRLEFGIEGE